MARDPIFFAKENRGTFLALAIVQCVLGCLTLGLGGGLLAIGSDDFIIYHYDSYAIEYPISTFILTTSVGVIVFSSFGILQGCQPVKCAIITNLVLAVFGMMNSASMAMICFLDVTSYNVHNTSFFLLCGSGASFSIICILFTMTIMYANRAAGCCCYNFSRRAQQMAIIAGAENGNVALPVGNDFYNPGAVIISQTYPHPIAPMNYNRTVIATEGIPNYAFVPIPTSELAAQSQETIKA